MIKKLVVFVTFFVFLTACKEKSKTPTAIKQDPAVPIEITVIALDTTTRFIEVNGVVMSKDFVSIQPEISGRITYLNIPEGKYVAQGTILAKIFDSDLQAQLKKQEAQLKLNILNEERLKKLLAIDATTQNEYDIAVTAIESSKADIEYTQSLISKTIIKAPFSGYIGNKNISIGAYVTPLTIMADFEGANGKILDADLPAKYLTSIKLGDTVKISVEGNPNQSFATVFSIEPAINKNSQNVKLRCRLNSVFKSGSFVKAVIETNKNDAIIFVPSSVIIPEGNFKKIACIKNNKPEFVFVETGYRTDKNVEIKKGLFIGDTIVTIGSLYLRPNSKISISKVTSLKNLIQ